MNKIKLCLVGLIVVLVLTQIAVTSSDVSSYDPMADVNRDGVVDVDDLYRVGKAYGSTSLFYEQNKTVITVFNETSPIENAIVAIFSSELGSYPTGQRPESVNYTNSDGVANLALTPNTEYTAIAWGATTYNYVQFVTNTFGEASISIMLSHGLKHLPSNWIVVTILNRTSGALYQSREHDYVWLCNISSYEYTGYETSVWKSRGPNGHDDIWYVPAVKGMVTFRKDTGMLDIFSSDKMLGVFIYNISNGEVYGNSILMPDEDGTANVVIYI